MIESKDKAIVEKLLASVNIQHGELYVAAVSNNVAITDDSTVFVKLSRPEFDAALLRNELTVASRYDSKLVGEPLHPELLEDGGRAASVWRYESLSPLSPKTATEYDAKGLAAVLNRIHELPANGLTSIRSLAFMRPKNDQRLEYGEAVGADLDTLRIIRELADRTLSDFELPIDGLTHGDTHLGNASKTRNGYRWFDWESARLAAREFDAAGLCVNLAMVGKNPSAWEAARDELEMNQELREDTLNRFITARLVSLCSFALTQRGGLEVARLRAESVESALRNGELPTSIAPLPNYG